MSNLFKKHCNKVLHLHHVLFRFKKPDFYHYTLLLCLIFLCSTGVFSSELVNLHDIDPTIHLDSRYATANNFTGSPVYDSPAILLSKPAALALKKVQILLKKQDLGLIIFDGYRSDAAVKILWDKASPLQKRYLTDPKIKSAHSKGLAADVSLIDLKTGKELEMPSSFDEFSPRASIFYYEGSRKARMNRTILIEHMEKAGFRVNTKEWWHFEYISK